MQGIFNQVLVRNEGFGDAAADKCTLIAILISTLKEQFIELTNESCHKQDGCRKISSMVAHLQHNNSIKVTLITLLDRRMSLRILFKQTISIISEMIPTICSLIFSLFSRFSSQHPCNKTLSEDEWNNKYTYMTGNSPLVISSFLSNVLCHFGHFVVLV